MKFCFPTQIFQSISLRNEDFSKRRSAFCKFIFPLAFFSMGNFICFFAEGSDNNGKLVRGSISWQGDIVHLEFFGLEDWDYRIEKKSDNNGKEEIQLLINPVDIKSLEEMKKFNSSIVAGISFETSKTDGKTLIRLPSNQTLDYFDYLTDQPSRLVLDIYPANALPNEIEKSGKKVKVNAKKEIPKNEVVKSNTALPKKDKGETSATSDRSPANDVMIVSKEGQPLDPKIPNGRAKANFQFGIFDGSDANYDRFNIKDYEIKEESIIQSRGNIYLEFPKIEVPILIWEKVNASGTIYEITPKDTQENKEARLLQTLYEKERLAVFLRTMGWFREKYPKSEYLELLEYMTGDVYLKLWRQSRFEQQYEMTLATLKEAINKFPSSPMAEKTSIKLGFLALEKGDFPSAVRLFNNHINSKYGANKSYSNGAAQLGKGLALVKQRMFGEALETFQKMAKESNFPDLKVEALYRIGDVFVAQAHRTSQPEEKERLLKDVVESYLKALKTYPGDELKYPSAYYNRAEALFGLKEFKQSLDVHREFLKKFPFNNFAVFSLTRIGELLEILGSDPNKVVGAFMEASFRFGDNPNIVITRLRLLSRKMKGMSPKEIETGLKEISDLVESSEIENIKQFSTMMIAEGFSRRGEPDRAIEYLTQYYRDNITTVDRKAFGKIIERNYNDKIQSLVEENKFIDALKTHRKYVKDWPFFTNRLDMKYSVARAYEQAGAYENAKEHLLNVLNKAYSYKGTPYEKELRVVENLPSDDRINLRLAKVSLLNKQYHDAYQFLRNIKKPETMPENEQIERVEIAVDLLKQKGDLDSAVRYLSELLRTWSGVPGAVSKPYLKMAEIEKVRGNFPEAMAALEKINELQSDSKAVPTEVHIQAMELQTKLFLESKNIKMAIKTLEKELDLYQEKLPLEHVRYQLGELYYKEGKIQKAKEIWSDFKVKEGFWNRLAEEKLKDAGWSDEYKKYIKRIPAMADLEEGQ